jgi:hypothetical protein
MLRFTDEKSKNIWGFDPRSLPGCMVWYDAADRSTFIKPDGNIVTTDGDEIERWNSKAGENRYMSNSYVSGAGPGLGSYNHPTYSSTGFNGKPCLSIYGSNSIISNFPCCFMEEIVSPNVELFPRSGINVSFQVFKPSSRTAGLGTYTSGLTAHGDSNSIPYSGGVDVPVANGMPPRFSTAWSYTPGGYSAPIPENGAYLPYDTPVMTTMKYTLEYSGLYQYTKETTTVWNGGNHTSLPMTISPSLRQFQTVESGGVTFIIGTSYYLYPFAYDDGLHAEYIVYNEALTIGQIQQVQGYLARKWGFTSYLPSTHPYYSIPSCNRMFQPLDIPGCILWLDGNDTTTMFQSDSSPITDPSQVTATWKDKSGKGNDFSGEGYGWTGYGMYISASSSFSNPSSYTTTQGTNVFVVWNKPYTTTQTVYLFSSTITPSNYVQISSDNFYIQDPTIGFNGLSYGPVTIDSNQPYLYCANTIRGYMPCGVNGNTSTGLITLAGTVNGNSRFSYEPLIGIATNSAATSSSWSISDGSDDIIIQEVLHYDAVLTTSQIDQIQGYLAWKWKLQDTPSKLEDGTSDNSTWRPSSQYYAYYNGYPYPVNPHPFALNPPGSAPAFSPKCIDGCMLWLDGADGPTISQNSGSFVPVTALGQSVYQWTDKALGGKVTTSSTGITYQTVPPGLSFGGLAGMSLSSSTAYSNANAPITTVFAVTKSTYTGTYTILGTRWNSGSNVLSLGISNSTQIVTNISGTTLLTGSNMGTGITLSSYTFDPVYSNGYMYSNGTQTVTATVTASNVNKALTDFSVGKKWNGSADTNFFKGSIHELIVYTGILTDDQRQKIEGYLAQKWHF